MRILAGLVLSIVIVTDAFAQWLYQEKDESAFSDQKIHMMLSIKSGRGLVVRCENGAKRLMFVLPEKPSEADAMNALDPKLLFRVDRNEPRELSATAYDQNGRFMLIAQAETELVEEIGQARKRIAVLLDLAGSRFVETSYSAKGSTKAATQLLANCKP